ncbi:unnamed protein product [Orchesella dallaii]|uniref:Uncharacterized protein n=1 Tax=Orchesella dallaii TaxID=48710 RepID=A0ABP1SAL4_9HEXA
MLSEVGQLEKKLRRGSYQLRFQRKRQFHVEGIPVESFLRICKVKSDLTRQTSVFTMLLVFAGAMSTRRRAGVEDVPSSSKRARQALLDQNSRQQKQQVIPSAIEHASTPINMLDVEKIVELTFSTDHSNTRGPINLAKVAFPTKDEA